MLDSQSRAHKVKLNKPNVAVQNKIKHLRNVRLDHNAATSIRIGKALAMSGVGSRRSCDQLITEQAVLINNKIATLGQQITTKDRITVHGKAVIIKWPDRVARIIIYHKPEGEIVTRTDPKQRLNVFSQIPILRNKRFLAVGRLDLNTSGLLIFTNSGTLAQHFTHPRYQIEREYAVRIFGRELTTNELKQLTGTGITLDDGIAKFAAISKESPAYEISRNLWYKVILKEGRNREIRRIFEHFGLTVSRLIRTRFGPIALPPRLKRGQYYELNALEVIEVTKKLGLNLAGSLLSENHSNK